MSAATTVHTMDGIDWYCEQQGSGSDIVLIPSGEGDCSSFDKVAASLAAAYRVTTFDMPGFSRTVAPEAAIEAASPAVLAGQVIMLLDELDIPTATFYGCSSGGHTGLSLVADYPDRVHRALVHEASLGGDDQTRELANSDDATIAATCKELYATSMVEDRAAWEALGPEFHKRMEKNYVTWVRRYAASPKFERIYSTEELNRAPITWTIGSMTPAGYFMSNTRTALGAGLEMGLLPCMHFPQVTIPDVLADHIRAGATG